MKARPMHSLSLAKEMSLRAAARTVVACLCVTFFGGCAQAWQGALAKEIGVSIIVMILVERDNLLNNLTR